MPASFPPPSGQLVVNKTFDALTQGTVPAGTMVSLTRTGTIIDKVGPAANIPSTTTLSASTTTNLCPCDMGSQTFVVAYNDTTNASATTLIAGSVSGSVITAGSPVVVSTSTSTTFHVCRLSNTLGIIVYNDTNNASTQTARAFSISGSVITLGTAQTTSTSTNTSGFSLWRTSNTTFLLAFNDSANSSRLSLVAGSVSGTTITVGAVVQLSTSTVTATQSNIAVLTSTSFAVSFCNGANSNKTSVIAGSLSTNTITLGTAVNATDTGNVSLVPFNAVLDSTHFIINVTNTAQVMFVLVSGTTVTIGSPVAAAAAASYAYNDMPFLNIMTVDSTHARLYTRGYLTSTSDTTGTYTITGWNGVGSNAGLFLTASLACSAENSSATNMSTTSMSGSTGSFSQGYAISPFVLRKIITHSTTRVLTFYQSSGIVVKILEIYPPGDPSTVGLYGITTAAGAAGQTVGVVVDGIATGLSGLTQLATAFADGGGVISSVTGSTGLAIGLTVDTTSVLLRKALSGGVVPLIVSP
jgi:hypothetical protein